MAELIAVAAACFGILQTHYELGYKRAAVAAYGEITQVKSSELDAMAAKAHKTSQERIVEEVDEIIWTKESLDYRTGPDVSYASAGNMEEERGIRRTGITKNEWSRVVIDEENYFIQNTMVTTETPMSEILYEGEKGEYQKYALSLFPDYDWSANELQPLINLWERESHWNPSAHNGRSGAHGIPQAVPASKMASEGSDYYTSAYPQIRWGLGYIRGRYGSPSSAWSFFQSNGWY